MKKTTSTRKKGRPNTYDLPFMDQWTDMSEDGRKFVASILALKSRDQWHGSQAVPPGTVLEDLLRSFERHTDIPLELPFQAWMTHLSGWLCSEGVKIRLNSTQVISPTIWAIVLASSAAGKSFAVDFVKKGMDKVPQMENTASGVALVQAIQTTPKGIWVRDEMGMYLKSIQTQPHMEKAKDILLNAYGGSPIQHITKSDKIIVKDHAFSILGITVGETFLDQIGADSLVDGFAQRFNYLIADKDKARKIQDFPLYFDDRKMDDEDRKRLKRIRDEHERILTRTDLYGLELTLSDGALDIFEEVFRDNFKGQVPESFYRRSMFSMFTYAALYHVLLDKRGSVIGHDAMAYASRVVMMHLKDVKKLLQRAGWSELELLIQRTEEFHTKYEERHGRKPTARDLISGVWAIKTIQQAKSLLEIIEFRRT